MGAVRSVRSGWVHDAVDQLGTTGPVPGALVGVVRSGCKRLEAVDCGNIFHLKKFHTNVCRGACAFYYAASWNHFDSNTWVYAKDLVPTDTTTDSAGNPQRYLYSLYWAVVTMATIGYGGEGASFLPTSVIC